MGCWLLMDSFQMPIPTHQLLCPSLPSLEMRPTNQKPVSITSVRKYHFCVMLQEKPSWSPELCIACEHRLGVQSLDELLNEASFADSCLERLRDKGGEL